MRIVDPSLRRMSIGWLCASLAVLALLSATPARAGGQEGILYVGDSLGVGTFPPLRSTMAGTALDGDTEVGRSSTEGLWVLRAKLRPRHGIVVFDLGTNDFSTETLTQNLHRARKQTRDRLMIVLTMNKPGVGRFNGAVRTFARSADNVVLIDWHATAGREALLAGDGIHASAWGYRRRAASIKRVAVRARSGALG